MHLEEDNKSGSAFTIATKSRIRAIDPAIPEALMNCRPLRPSRLHSIPAVLKAFTGPIACRARSQPY
jgi:hypothetical protein